MRAAAMPANAIATAMEARSSTTGCEMMENSDGAGSGAACVGIDAGVTPAPAVSPANIAANVRALTESRFSEAALDALAARVAAEVPKGSAP